MGAPAFQYRDLFERQRVAVYSSNFSLYGDMSQRVMEILHSFCADIEIYSVDEAFLYADPRDDLLGFGKLISKEILKQLGLPVTVGFAPTKTLAKVANKKAKKEGNSSIVLADAEEISNILALLPLKDIWGIGRRIEKKLNSAGIWTAQQLCEAPDSWIKMHLSVVGLRTVWELRGIPCLDVEEIAPPKQSITSSRSFGMRTSKLDVLEEALSYHASRIGEKLRQEQRLAQHLQAFVFYKVEGTDGERGMLHKTAFLPQATDYTPTLIKVAKDLIRSVYQPHLTYVKAGILVHNLISHDQMTLFSSEKPKHQELMHVIDSLNSKSRKRVFFAAEGLQKTWKAQSQKRSSCYTTSWKEILVLKN